MSRLVGLDPSGSSLDRISLCPASAALPQVFDANDANDQNSAKKRGSAKHDFLDNVAKLGDRSAALALVDEQHREECEGIDLAKLADRLTLSTEVAVAYNFKRDTARKLQPKAPRVYEIDLDEEIAATIDVAAYDPDAGRVYSGDYKGPRAWLPAPEASMQLGLGAVALSRIYDASEADVEYIRILDDGSSRRRYASLDAFALAGARKRIRGTMDLVESTREIVDAGKAPNVTEGPHCRYCPARFHCPAKVAAMRAVLANPLAFATGQDIPVGATLALADAITPENASMVMDGWRKATDALSSLGSAIYAYAKLTPIPRGTDPDGALRMFGELRRPGSDVLDGKIVHRAITEEYGPEAANKVVTMEATKTAIGELIKERKPSDDVAKATKWTQKAQTEKVLGRVRELGGISNPETCTTTEYTISESGETRARKKRAS